MKKLLILGNTSCVSNIINYAKSNNIYTIFTDYLDKERYKGMYSPDEFWDIDVKDIDELEKRCILEHVDGVIAGISEFCLDNVIELCSRLHLPCYCDKYSWHYNRDKADFKQKCREVGLNVAEDYSLNRVDDIVYPVVVKPVDKCLNEGLSYCNNKEELLEGIKLVKNVSNNEKIIIERKITGKEFLGYYILANGDSKLEYLSTSSYQEGEPACCYSYNITNSEYLDQYLKEIDPYAKKLLKAIGAKEGVAWIQYFLDDINKKMYAIEMGYRLNGDFSFCGAEMINKFSSIKWLVDYALGKKHDIKDFPETVGVDGQVGCGYILWSRISGKIKSITGLENIDRNKFKFFDLVHEGQYIEKYKPMVSVSFCGKNEKEIQSLVKEINNKLYILDENGANMYIRFDSFNQ